METATRTSARRRGAGGAGMEVEEGLLKPGRGEAAGAMDALDLALGAPVSPYNAANRPNRDVAWWRGFVGFTVATLVCGFVGVAGFDQEATVDKMPWNLDYMVRPPRPCTGPAHPRGVPVRLPFHSTF